MYLFFLSFLNVYLEVCKSQLVIYLSISSFHNPSFNIKYSKTSSSNEKQTNINSTDTCFHSDGESYRGNVSVTRSGYTCQSGTSQCPHRHHRTPDNFPELSNAGNACRNPGGQAPHGPWCYTTNRKQRWEYCRVEKCEARKENEGLFMENVSGLRCIRRVLNEFVRMHRCG